MIELTEVRKSYGKIQALRGISTSIARGEIVGLLGPNGAGKTTAMKILVGYLLPDEGRVTVGGHDVVEEPLAVQSRIGYLPENAPVYGDMLVQEYLRFVADMRGLVGDQAVRQVRAAAAQCAVDRVLTRTIGHLSKGFRQRVGLAAAILHDPEILILDEPTSGLDPNQIVEVRELIHHMGRTKTVILSTHILSEVEASCSRAVILIDGRIRADGRLDELTRSRAQVVTLAPHDPAQAAQALERIPGVAAAEAISSDGRFLTYRLRLDSDREIGESVFELARDRGWPVRELRRDDRTLEQVFRELTESPVEVAA
jgi:ABC-2 type transport system ATP-binding protein